MVMALCRRAEGENLVTRSTLLGMIDDLFPGTP